LLKASTRYGINFPHGFVQNRNDILSFNRYLGSLEDSIDTLVQSLLGYFAAKEKQMNNLTDNSIILM
jgi:hypothetical protein